MAVEQVPSTPVDAANDTLSKRPLYEGSTQYQHWRFSPEQLHKTREVLNTDAIAAIRSTFEADSPGSSSDIQFLTYEEEILLVKLYVTKITQLCGHFRFPEEVEATAISYLKRFYLKNTVMDWHPKNVMLTALFLATKTTNHPISLEAYTSNIPRTAPSDVLDLEFLVAQSLAFEFAVWHVHRALWGIWLDAQDLPIPVPPERLQQAYDSALQYVGTSRITDAEFLFTPSQIALACLSLADHDLALRWATAKGVEANMETIEKVAIMVTRDGVVPSVEVVREIDRRLRLCKNPEKVVGSKAYIAKLAKVEREAEVKRARKAEEIRKAMEDGDPFGSELNDGARVIADLDEDD